MKRLLLVSLLAITALPLIAQRDATRIAVIDMERIYTELAEDAEIRREMRQTLDSAKNRATRIIAEIQAKRDRIETDEALSDVQTRELLLEIDIDQERLALLLDEQEQLVRQLEEEISRAMLIRIQDAAERIANERNIDIVLERRQANVIFARAEIDITLDVINRLRLQEQEAEKQ